MYFEKIINKSVKLKMIKTDESYSMLLFKNTLFLLYIF